MCPSVVHKMEVGSELEFGPAIPVFVRENYCPCSINIRQTEILSEPLIVQIRRDGSDWLEYEPGQMIIGKNVECRISSLGQFDTAVEVEVFYN